MGGFYSSDLYKKFKESGVGGVWWHANVRGARLINSKLTDELANKDKLELSAMLDTSNAIIKKTGLAMRYTSMIFRLLIVAMFPLFYLIYIGNSNVSFFVTALAITFLMFAVLVKKDFCESQQKILTELMELDVKFNHSWVVIEANNRQQSEKMKGLILSGINVSRRQTAL